MNIVIVLSQPQPIAMGQRHHKKKPGSAHVGVCQPLVRGPCDRCVARMQIKNRLRGENVNLSLPSQRVDRFDEDIANIVSSGKKSSLTFAPEAGTQRLRDIVNKGLSGEELLRGIRNAWDQGWRRVRYHMTTPLPLSARSKLPIGL